MTRPGSLEGGPIARELVTRFHDAPAAEKAASDFASIYSKDAVPDDVPEVEVKVEGDTLWIAKALSSAGLVKSTSEGRRMVGQGGVEIDQKPNRDPQLQLAAGGRTPTPKKLIDPRPNVALAAKSADILITTDGLVYVTDWNAGLNVLQYEG